MEIDYFHRMKNILFIFIALSFFSCDPSKELTKAGDTPEMTTIILVRHAEKEGGRNPALTSAGKERANLLAEMLSKMQVNAVYSSDFLRTKQTAEPTADLAGLEIKSYDHNELSMFANLVKKRHQGETVLVVGHSNTTPELASHLDPNNDYERFSELDYGNLLIINISASGQTKVLQLTF